MPKNPEDTPHYLNQLQQFTQDLRHIRDSGKDFFWHNQQTMQTIFPYSLGELYELGEAIESQDNQAIKDELGDLLLQVAIYAQIAELHHGFDLGDIIQQIHDKIIRRHPHVFADVVYNNIEEQQAGWDAIKAREKITQQQNSKSTTQDLTQDSPFATIPRHLTALQHGQLILAKAAETGFDWPTWKPVIDKLYEETQEIIDAVENGESAARIEEEVGDLLVVVMNLARHLNVDSEQAARKANKKFERRYLAMQQAVQQHYPEQTAWTLEQMDTAWEAVKSKEKEQA